jgi:hypothetical protein
MKWSMALAVLQQLPAILQLAENLFPGQGKSNDKKLTASSQMVQYEGALALDQGVQAAKSALIDAQVAYANAMDKAAAAATALNIPVAPLVTPPPVVPIGGVVATPATAGLTATHPRALTETQALQQPAT